MDESEALEIFAGADEDAARQAWGQLRWLNSRYLKACLHKAGCHDEEEQEEIIQETFLKVWQARSRFQFQGIGAWRRYLGVVAKNCYLDILDKKERFEDEPHLADVPIDELPIVDTVLNALIAETLDHCAHVLWLGLDPLLSEDVHNRQLLAAQLYYLDGDSWEQVCDTLPSLTRETLDEWLSHAGVIRYLAYQELYYSNESLARHLLGAPSTDLDELMRQATHAASEAQSPSGWTWEEVKVILWRHRNGLLIDQILQRLDCPYNREDLRTLLDRLTALFPFSSQMARVLSALDRAPGLDARSVLGGRSLWQRLAFQYRYGDDIAHRDIQERTQPAAERVGYEVKLDVLNVWLSNGRLLKQLAEFYRTVKGEADDE